MQDTATLKGPMRLPCPSLPWIAALFLLWTGTTAQAQHRQPASREAERTVPAVLLSDIHFDPFHNPHDLAQLRASPVEQWPAILSAATSLPADVDRVAVDAECHARTSDTGWPLLQTTLQAAREAEPHPIFVTLSGDLLAHEFRCRFHHFAPSATAQDFSGFSAKTVAFVALELRLAFPHVPVYVALGNNDSGCFDYAETPGSPFLQSAAGTLTAGIGNGGGMPRAEFSAEGDYSLTLPAPLAHGRLIVLQDIFDSENYKTCGQATDHAPETSQLGWLRQQLETARSRGEQVWVLGHIPPGVDVYASFHRYLLRPGELCDAQIQPFLSDTRLADTLLDYADVIRLTLFAHTHMDEIRLLHRDAPPTNQPPSREAGPDADARTGRDGAALPVKMVPSVTPYFGNHPAFLVAAIDPRTLVLRDWETVVSPASEGSAAPWTVGYRYSAAYGLPDLSAASAALLANGFTADRAGKATRSATYREHFFAGDVGLYALGLGQIWPAYACAVREDQPRAFHDCLCPAATPTPGN